jgi:hypothetical protein
MSDYPLHGYLYDVDGFHGPPVVLHDRAALHAFLARAGLLALLEHRELRLTSADDDDLYVHIQDGVVLYASGADCQAFQQTILAAAVLEPEEPTP